VITAIVVAVATVALLLASARDNRRNRNTREGQ
jgi:multisubunit Na+/H+ antiporter MnhC subunit